MASFIAARALCGLGAGGVISLGSIITSGENLEESILPIAACFTPNT